MEVTFENWKEEAAYLDRYRKVALLGKDLAMSKFQILLIESVHRYLFYFQLYRNMWEGLRQRVAYLH